MTPPILGRVMLFAGDFVPKGWSLADGRSLPKAQNHALYAVLQGRFGEDSEAFQLPDLRGTEPAPGLVWCIAVQGRFPSRGG